MEIFRLPLYIVIALWFIRRMNPSSFFAPLTKYYDSIFAYLNDAMLIDDPQYKVGRVEALLRSIVSGYRNRLKTDVDRLADTHVVGFGFIRKTDKQENEKGVSDDRRSSV